MPSLAPRQSRAELRQRLPQLEKQPHKLLPRLALALALPLPLPLPLSLPLPLPLSLPLPLGLRLSSGRRGRSNVPSDQEDTAAQLQRLAQQTHTLSGLGCLLPQPLQALG